MPASTPPRRHLVRWITLAIAAVLVALAAALAIHVHALLQPQRFTQLLERDLSIVGLSLKLQSPAEPMLFPHPGVRLEGITLTNTGAATPLLEADSATVVVPWRAVLYGDAAIERVDINAPRVNLGEIKALLARLPHHAGPPRLPTIATGIHLSQGTLIAHAEPRLFGLNIDTGTLAPGQPFRLDASARSRSGQAFSGSLTTVPSAPHDGAIDFMPISVAINAQGGVSLQLSGRGSWRGDEDLALQLGGTFTHTALATPAAATSSQSALAPASAPGATRLVTDTLNVDVMPGHGTTPLTVALKLEGVDAHVDLRLQPVALANWWNRLLATQPVPAPMPNPFTGTAKIQNLDLGWLHASGIEIKSGPDAQPATSAAGASPASATTTAH